MAFNPLSKINNFGASKKCTSAGRALQACSGQPSLFSGLGQPDNNQDWMFSPIDGAIQPLPSYQGGSEPTEIDWEKVKEKVAEYWKIGTDWATDWAKELSDDYKNFQAVNQEGKARRKTNIYSKASEFFNKKIGNLAAGQIVKVISTSGSWYYISVQGLRGYVLAETIMLLDDFDWVEKEYGPAKDWAEASYLPQFNLNLPPHWVIIQGPSGYPARTIFYQDTKNGELIFITLDPTQGNVIKSGVYGTSQTKTKEVEKVGSGLATGALVAGAAALYLLSQ